MTAILNRLGIYQIQYTQGPSLPSLNYLAYWFHMRRLKCEKVADDGRQMPYDNKSSSLLV
jgi:hypothetical protein